MLLSTAHLILKELTNEDIESFASVFAEIANVRFSFCSFLAKDETLEYLHYCMLIHYIQHGFGLWSITSKIDNYFVGVAGLKVWTIDGHEEVELAYQIDPHYESPQFILEACSAISEYAFKNLQLNRLISMITSSDSKTLKIAEDLGMRFWKKTQIQNRDIDILVLDK